MGELTAVPDKGWDVLIDGIERLAAAANPRAEGDYLDDSDGLLHCGKCGTRKQTRIHSIVLGDRVVSCLCRCGEEKAREEEEFLRRAARYVPDPSPAEKRARTVFRTPAWAECTFDRAQDSDIIRRCRRYAENFDRLSRDGQGMILFGGTGTGKTYAAACVVNYLKDRGYRCQMTTFSRIANEQPGFGEKGEYFDNFNSYDLLVIDDFQSERQTEFMQEVVYNVIDGRYTAGRPVILTTNMDAQSLQNPVGAAACRVMSRLRERCVCLPVIGPDRRGTDHRSLLDILDG